MDMRKKIGITGVLISMFIVLFTPLLAEVYSNSIKYIYDGGILLNPNHFIIYEILITLVGLMLFKFFYQLFYNK